MKYECVFCGEGFDHAPLLLMKADLRMCVAPV